MAAEFYKVFLIWKENTNVNSSALRLILIQKIQYSSIQYSLFNQSNRVASSIWLVMMLVNKYCGHSGFFVTVAIPQTKPTVFLTPKSFVIFGLLSHFIHYLSL